MFKLTSIFIISLLFTMCKKTNNKVNEQCLSNNQSAITPRIDFGIFSKCLDFSEFIKTYDTLETFHIQKFDYIEAHINAKCNILNGEKYIWIVNNKDSFYYYNNNFNKVYNNIRHDTLFKVELFILSNISKPNPDTIYNIIDTLYVKYRNKPSNIGVYQGYNTDNPSDTFSVEINFFQSKVINFDSAFTINNLPKGFLCHAFVDYGNNCFFINECNDNTPIAGYYHDAWGPMCGNYSFSAPRGWGEFIPNERKLIINYNYYEKNNSNGFYTILKSKTFIGKKVF